MDTSTFYSAASALCFTLLGFWWVVVQFRHAELTRDAAARRFTFLVSLHFIVPGLVSLASLLATGPMWRIAFGLAGLTGLAATWVGVFDAGSIRSLLGGMHRALWLGFPVLRVL